MCRSIKTLRRKELPATEEECAAAALQYVRKISGYRKPSKQNAAAFEEAVNKITLVTRELLERLDVGKAEVGEVGNEEPPFFVFVSN